jgi:outer membrane protein assembly factor BamB
MKSRFKGIVALAAFCVQPSIFTNAVDWPQWQGPDRTAVSKERGLLQQWPKEGPLLAWRISGLGGGYNSPAVAGGRIYGMSSQGADEVAWALSEADGKVVWKTRLGAASREGMPQGSEGAGCTPTVDGDHLYVLGLGGDLACLRASDGGVVWRRNLISDFGGVLPTWRYNESPLIDGGKVVCTPGGPDATVVALDKRNGELIWKSVVPEPASEETTPSIMETLPVLAALDTDKNKVISTAEMQRASETLTRLDQNQDGKLTEEELRPPGSRSGEGARGGRNRGGRGGMRFMPVHATLNANENNEIDNSELKNAAAALRKLDKNNDGTLTEEEVGPPGRRNSGAGYASAIAVDFEGQRQYVQLTAKSLVGLAASDGRLVWRYDKPASRSGINCSTPIYFAGKVFASSAYGNGGGMAKLSRDGAGSFKAEEVWFSKDMENHHGGVLLIDGALYGANGGNGGGYLACLDFQTGDVLWNEADQGKRRVTKGSVALADGRIYYRTEEGPIVLIEPSRREYIERGRFEQPDRTEKPAWAHPVIANGKLYIRDQDLLLCYDIKNR